MEPRDVSGPLETVVFHEAIDPGRLGIVCGKVALAMAWHGFSLEGRSAKIDLHPPAGIVAEFDFHAIKVLPLAIAVVGKPFRNFSEGVLHGFRIGTSPIGFCA